MLIAGANKMAATEMETPGRGYAAVESVSLITYIYSTPAVT